MRYAAHSPPCKRARRSAGRRLKPQGASATDLILAFLGLGSVYALFALGYTLTFGVTRSFNFARAAVFSIGAVAAMIFARAGDSLWIAAAYATLAGGFAGVAIDLVAGWPLRRRRSGPNAPMIASVAVFVLCIDLGERFVKGGPAFALPARELASLRFGSQTLSWPSLTAITLCGAALVGVHLLLRGTRAGLAMRAVASDAAASQGVGIGVGSIVAQTTFVASLLGALAGASYAFVQGGAAVPIAYVVQLPALAAVVLGGGRSVSGTVVAGYVVAAVQVAVSKFLPAPWYLISPLAVALAAMSLIPRGILASRALRSA
jgi:branched-chain amino acid transport system permease protein